MRNIVQIIPPNFMTIGLKLKEPWAFPEERRPRIFVLYILFHCTAEREMVIFI
jgi:hypothetical protein